MSAVDSRNAWVDVLRGLAASAVVLFHFNVIPYQGTPEAFTAVWRAFWGLGHLGVPVFFVLSGYCIALAWIRADDWRGFAWRRARRILPPYYASLLVIGVLAVSFKLTRGVNDVASLPTTPKAVLATLTLTTAPVTSVPTLNWVYWSLSYEVAFYVLMGLLLLLPVGRRHLALAALHLFMCGFSALRLPVFFFTDLWPLFGAGTALALWPGNRGVAVTMLVGNVLHAAARAVVGADELEYLLAGGAAVGLLVLSGRRRFPAWLERLRRLGIFSYSLYLIHVPVGCYGLLRLLPTTFPSDVMFIFLQSLVFAGTLGCSYVFYLACERPFMGGAKAVR